MDQVYMTYLLYVLNIYVDHTVDVRCTSTNRHCRCPKVVSLMSAGNMVVVCLSIGAETPHITQAQLFLGPQLTTWR